MFVNFNILNQLGSPAINSNTFANRPAAGQTGRLFVSTDTFEIYRDNGTTWDLIGGPGSSTITGTGTATQVAYFTSSQAIGSSANLFWDNTNTRLGVGTATPGYTIEANGAVKADRIYLTGATAFNGALYWVSDRVTLANYNVGGIVHIETNGGPPAAIFGADYTATFTSGIGTRGYTGSTSYGALFNGSVGINTATPGAALDIHSTGTIAQFNTTAATGNVFLAIQRSGTGLWRIGDTYNGGSNFFELHNTALANNAIQIAAATNKSILTSIETYSTGVARGNLLDYTLSLANGTTFTSPNTVTALGATLNLNIAGSATIPAGARSGADFFNGINFTSAGTFTVNQSTTIRAFSNVTAGWAFNGSAVGTVTHLAGLRVLFPTNSGSAINVTDNYALLINDQNANTGTITYTNRWGIYQEGASDLNYMAANLLLGSTTNNGAKLQINGAATISSNAGGALSIGGNTIGNGVISITKNSSTGSEVSAAIAINATNTGGNTELLIGADETNAVAYFQTAAQGTSYSAKQLSFQPNGGNVLIGTVTNNGPKLSVVKSGISFDTAALFLSTGTSATDGLAIGDSGNGAYKSLQSYGGALVFNSLGNNILIGTTTDAGQKLQVNGNGLFTRTSGVTLEATQTTATNSHTALIRQTGAGGNGNQDIGLIVDIQGANDDDRIANFRYYDGSIYNSKVAIKRNGNIETAGSIKTAAPTSGTAASWKLGTRVAAAVVLDATQYIELDVNGTLYKLAVVT